MLSVNLSGIDFKNPIAPASGTFGYGYEMSKFYDINLLGSIAIKSCTLESRFGNELPRVCEVDSGMINSIGLQNPGIEDIISNQLIKLEKLIDYKIIANVSGSTIQEYVKVCMMLDRVDIVGILEINVSCPNVKSGGIHFGVDEKLLSSLIKEIKANVTKPVYVKLSPNISDIVKMSVACQNAGADGLVLINTLVGMKIDIYNKEYLIKNKVGGVSGKLLKPIAVRMVHDVYKNVSIPIIGCGGLSNAQDVVEMMMAGASFVQIGTQNFIDPFVCKNIISELETLVTELGYNNINEIVGVIHE